MRRRAIQTLIASALSLFAITVSASPSTALNYAYNVGHPMYVSVASGSHVCTGGWAIYGNSGSFLLTSADCAAKSKSIYGTTSYMGFVEHVKGRTALVRATAGVTPYQTLVDPKSGARPGGTGRVTGLMPTAQQRLGMLVGKVGMGTGWSEGYVRFRSTEPAGQPIWCASYSASSPDLGAPIWRNDGNGLRAVGIHVLRSSYNGETVGCYIPMESVLANWGASMNFHSRTTARSAVPPIDQNGDLPPYVDPSDLNFEF